MSNALLRIAKLIPRLGGASSESEQLTALRMIEKALLSEELTFVDAGLKLAEFIKSVMDVDDDETPTVSHDPVMPMDPVRPSAAPQWNNVRGYSSSTQQARPSTQPPPFTRPQAQHARPSTPPSQRPILWSEQLNLTDHDYALRIEEILRVVNKRYVQTAKEKKFLEDMYFSFTSGFGGLTKLSMRQKQFLDSILDRMPF